MILTYYSISGLKYPPYSSGEPGWNILVQCSEVRSIKHDTMAAVEKVSLLLTMRYTHELLLLTNA